MAVKALHFVTQLLSVGNAFQNIAFYSLMTCFVWLIIAQLQTKLSPIKRRSFVK
jgi:hypothetical protein